MTELAIIENLTPAAVFTEKKVDDFLTKLEEEVSKVKLDISTSAGREEVKSLAYKIARTKTTLDDAGKDMTESWRQQTSVVNEERRKIRERLDSLKEKVRKPLTEYEERAKARIAELEGKLNDIISTKENLSEATSEQIQDRIANVNDTHGQTVWDEYYQRATYEMQEAIKALEIGLEAAKKREADAAELEKLRKEKVEREQKERDDRIAKEAEDRVRKEAEDERQRIADEAAAKEAEDKKRREDEAHREKTKQRSVNSLEQAIKKLPVGIAFEIIAFEIVDAIAEGKIANVKMEF